MKKETRRLHVRTDKPAIILRSVMAFWVLAWASLASTGTIPGGPTVAWAGELKVGFIYSTPVGDAGWSQAHDQGRLAIAAMPGVTTMYVESVPEGSFSETVFRNLARQGRDLIFATSFGYQDQVLKVAAEFPNVVFMHCAGQRLAANVGTYFGRIHQPMYLAGLTAGFMSSSGKLGFVAAYPIPEVLRNINAFTMGVRAANPRARVLLAWTHTWFNPELERKTALTLLDQGVDVLAQHQDSPAIQIAAQERGGYSVGYNSDMSLFAPKSNLTSAVWNWPVMYRSIVGEIQAGTWRSQSLWWGIDRGVVDLAPFGPMVPAEVRRKVAEARQVMLAGPDRVFSGPIQDQNGHERLPAGRIATDQELLDMDWLIQGVIGQIE